MWREMMETTTTATVTMIALPAKIESTGAAAVLVPQGGKPPPALTHCRFNVVVVTEPPSAAPVGRFARAAR